MTKVFEFKSNGKFLITVDDNNLKIHPKGFSNFLNKGGSKGEKSIPIKSITAIQFKKSSLTTGYVQFAYSGSSETKGGALDAVRDENTITFNKKELDKANELVELIESKRQNSSSSSKSISVADELKKFKDLMDEGIISEKEFQKKKEQLLGL